MSVATDPGLRERLLAIPGVAGAEVVERRGRPTRIRLELGPDAEPRWVMETVRGLLAEEGLGVRAAPPRSKLEPHAPPPPPQDGRERARPAPAPAVGPPREEPAAAPRRPELAGITVEEEADRIVVRARRGDEVTVTRRAHPDRRGLDEAILAAVGALLDPEAPPPRLVALRQEEVEGSELVTVVVEGPDGRRRAGSSLVRAGHPYALGRAVWAALTAEG